MNGSTGRQSKLGKAAAGLVLLAAGLAALPLGGCNIAAIAGAMADSYYHESSHTVVADYKGLDQKTFAVVVTADRVIQSDFADVVTRLTLAISADLARNANAAGVVPGANVLEYQYNHPQVVSYGQMAKELGVQRLVVIELLDYRLNDPGNQYLWAGVATGVVNVIDAEGQTVTDDYTYSKTVSVKYPDTDGFSPENLSRKEVNSVLAKRFADRASWLFYDHDEKYYPDY